MGTRTRADEAPVRVRIPRGVTERTKRIGLFVADNPFFTRDEIKAQLGADVDKVLDAMASDNRIKQVGTNVFCDPIVDATDPQVEKLIFLSGSKRISADVIARRARKGLVRKDRTTERPETSIEIRLRNWIRNHKVFSRADARAKFGPSSAQAIVKLLQNREIATIFAGTYVSTSVLPNRRYQVYRDYVAAKSAIQSAAILAIDASQRRLAKSGPAPAPVVKSIDDEYKPWLGRKVVRKLANGAQMKQRIWVNFHHLETIFAVAGGENNTMPLWRPKKGSMLTNDAAAILAAQIFPADMTFGQLCALAADIRNRKMEMPGFRPGGRFDHKPRFGETERGRYMANRKGGFSMPAQCTLTIDQREDKRIIEALHGIKNLEVDVAVLDTGDYRFQWGPNEAEQVLLVERKAWEDFGSSMENGTMEEQIQRMKDLPCHKLLIAEGRIFEDSGTVQGEKNDRQKTKWMASIATSMPVVPTPNWQRTVDALLIIARRTMIASGVPDLPADEADPKTDPCEDREHTAAGRRDAPSSESTRSDAAA